MESKYPKFGANLNALIHHKDKKQRKCWNYGICAYETVNKYIKGERNPKLKTIKAIAEFYNVNWKNLAYGDITNESLDFGQKRLDVKMCAALVELLDKYAFIKFKPKKNGTSENFNSGMHYFEMIKKEKTPTELMFSECKNAFFNSLAEDKIYAGAANVLSVVLMDCINASGNRYIQKNGYSISKYDDVIVDEIVGVKRSKFSENEDIFWSCMLVLKNSSVGNARVADYYLALLYFLDLRSDLLDSDSEYDSFYIGINMMHDLAELGNKYAEKFLDAFFEICEKYLFVQ